MNAKIQNFDTICKLFPEKFANERKKSDTFKTSVTQVTYYTTGIYSKSDTFFCFCKLSREEFHYKRFASFSQSHTRDISYNKIKNSPYFLEVHE